MTGSPETPPVDSSPMPVRGKWARALLRVPELDRLLSDPTGARIAGNFDSLHVRLEKAVDRIDERARAACLEIRRRAAVLRLVALLSAGVCLASAAVAILLPAFRLPLALIAAAEAECVVVLGLLQRRLARDLIAAGALEGHFREDLEAARTPEDLKRLGERIRTEVAAALGGEAAGRDGPAAA